VVVLPTRLIIQIDSFAASWKHKQERPLDVIEGIHREYKQKLELLSQVLPPRFKDSIDSVLADLHLLSAAAYPLALSHEDLCEMNIFVDSDTGQRAILRGLSTGLMPRSSHSGFLCAR
jgi:hypothetical protein